MHSTLPRTLLLTIAGTITAGAVLVVLQPATAALNDLGELTVEQLGIVGGPLRPGRRVSLTLTIHNSADHARIVTEVNGDGSAEPDQRHPDCRHTGLVLPQGRAVRWELPAHSTRRFVLVDALHMTNASDSGCQGASFSIPIAVS